MHRGLKGKLVVGLAALVVIALAGGAYAATQSSGPPTRQAFLNDVAKRLHVTPQQLIAALHGAETDQLQAQVKAGRLTQAQANALEQRLKQKGATLPVPFGFFGPPGLVAPGLVAPGPVAPGLVAPGLGRPYAPIPGGPGGYLAPRFRGFFVPAPFFPLGVGASTAASYLGLTNAKLLRELSSGKSLAQIATAQHKSVSGLEQAIIGSLKTRLDKLVKAKLLTSAQEQKMLSRWQTVVAQQVKQNCFLLPRLRARALRFRGTLPTPGTLVPPAGLQVPVPLAAPPA